MRNLIIAALVVLLLHPLFGAEGDAPRNVYEIEVSDQGRFMVDEVLASYLRNSLETAKDADLVILRIDTNGGMISSMQAIRETIRDMVLENDTRIVAYIPHKAISAGAAITIACPEIVMREGAQVGDCAPVTADPEGGLKMLNENDKITSVLRADFEAACRKYNYPYRLGHAMVSQQFATYVLFESSRVKLYSFAEFKSLPAVEREKISGGDVPTRTEFFFPAAVRTLIDRETPTAPDKADPEAEDKEPVPAAAAEPDAPVAGAGAEIQPVIVVIDEVFEVDGSRLCFLSESPEAKKDFTSLSDPETAYVKRKLLEQVDSSEEMVQLTAEKAYRYHFARKVVKTDRELYEFYHIDPAAVIKIKPSTAETVVRWLNNPMIAGLLIMIGMIAIYTELHTPGFGVAGITALACFGTYFVISFLASEPHLLPVILFLVGLALLLVEIFVIPGFGITGILGIIFIMAGLLTVRLPSGFFESGHSMEWRFEAFGEPLLVVFGGFCAGIIGILIIARYLPETSLFTRHVVTGPDTIESAVTAGVTAANIEVAVREGDEGVAATDLRPAGRATIGEHTVTAVANGEYIDKGSRIRVLKLKGNQIIVEKA